MATQQGALVRGREPRNPGSGVRRRHSAGRFPSPSSQGGCESRAPRPRPDPRAPAASSLLLCSRQVVAGPSRPLDPAQGLGARAAQAPPHHARPAKRCTARAQPPASAAGTVRRAPAQDSHPPGRGPARPARKSTLRAPLCPRLWKGLLPVTLAYVTSDARRPGTRKRAGWRAGLGRDAPCRRARLRGNGPGGRVLRGLGAKRCRPREPVGGGRSERACAHAAPARSARRPRAGRLKPRSRPLGLACLLRGAA